MKKLKCSPARPAYPATPTSSSYNVDDIRPRPYSELDNFVRKSTNSLKAGEYRRIVTKLYLAQRFCFGFTDLISFVDLLLRALLCYISAMQFINWGKVNKNLGLSFCSDEWMTGMDSAVCLEAVREIRWDWCSFSKVAGLTFAGHAYGMLKGYS